MRDPGLCGILLSLRAEARSHVGRLAVWDSSLRTALLPSSPWAPGSGDSRGHRFAETAWSAPRALEAMPCIESTRLLPALRP